MRLTRKLLAVAAGTVIAGGIAVAATGTADAATPSCGSSCIDVFSHDFGTYSNPQFLLDVYKRGENVGQPVILFRESNSDPAEDFTVSDQGTVADFYSAGLMSSTLALHYGCGGYTSTGVCVNGNPDAEAFEVEYAPYGADTGLCVGVAATAAQGEKVSLQPCGVSSKTVWVWDVDDAANTPGFSFPFINGSDMNFSHPFVATYPAGSYPTDSPRPQLYVSNLTGFSGTGPIPPSSLGVVSDTQLWNVDLFGQVF